MKEVEGISAAGHKKLDKLNDAIKTDPAREPLRQIEHRCGRPHNGRVSFSQQRVDSIPELSNAFSLARALCVARPTVRQWYELKQNPLPYVLGKNKRKMFRRDVVIKWLISTRRFNESPEYAVQSPQA